ncbi:MAG: hypothetical protein AAF250_15305 [Pseudomonadota bacterium]
MRAPWRSLSKPESVRIVAPDGTQRCQIEAFYCGSHFMVEDMSADMQPGDELRRVLPNGKDDVYLIKDPAFFNTGMIPDHYQVKVERKGVMPANSGGHYISVSGPNSRVNINSTDNSNNANTSNQVFADMRIAVNEGVSDEVQRQAILAAIDEAEEAKGTAGFTSAYQKLMGSAANHMTVIAPFLPGLSQMLS